MRHKTKINVIFVAVLVTQHYIYRLPMQSRRRSDLIILLA